ncbi:MAG: cupin domain-containing protein [Bacillota bacterium]
MHNSTSSNCVTVLPGVTRETLATGERLMVVRFTFEAGAQVPLHRHLHEQSSYIERGRLKYVIDGIERVLGPGESLVIPTDVPHEATALEDTVDINSLSGEP